MAEFDPDIPNTADILRAPKPQGRVHTWSEYGTPHVVFVEITDWGGKLDMDARSTTSTQGFLPGFKVGSTTWRQYGLPTFVFRKITDWGGRLDVGTWSTAVSEALVVKPMRLPALVSRAA
ncbi:MAG: hypothetical protein Q9208_007688 [Pyrenodesmia sp. 3 TL-2023]